MPDAKRYKEKKIITFTASLKNLDKCIKLDGELEAEVIFSVSASEIAELIKLVTFAGKSFKVTITEVEGEREVNR